MDRQHYLNQPAEISIETFAFCNAACTFCPYPTLDRKGTRMDDDLLYRLVDEMSEFQLPFTLAPFKVNEPLLDTRLITFLRTVNLLVPDASLRVFTNGSPLTAVRMAEIASLENVTHLWISLNSHEPNDYHRLMGLDFERTAKRLDELHTQVFHKFFLHPVVLSKVKETRGNDLDFIKYCVLRWPLFDIKLIKLDSWLGYVAPTDPVVPDTSCARWFELSILATGVVSLCCMDGKGDFPIGDLNTSTLLDVYNSPHWRTRREQLLSRRLVHPCNTCSY